MNVPAKPTAKQMAYLRALAASRGQTFTYPKTSRQASAEIRRLKALPPTSRVERRIERDEGDRHVDGQQLNSPRVRDDEVAGWGSTATWR
jgi:hypothetical protein